MMRYANTNLACGASLDNTVVFDASHVMNPEGLRFPTECVRHKILDLVGDLYLLGWPVIGHITAHKSGHQLNYQLVQALLANPSHWTLKPANALSAALSVC